MAATNNTHEQQLKAVTAVMRRIPDRTEQRRVLEALFAEPRTIAPRGFRGRPPRDETGLKPHGTEAAYQRHKARREDACAPCLAAANEARAASSRRARARKRAEAAAKAVSDAA